MRESRNSDKTRCKLTITNHNQDEENIRWIYGLLMKGLYEALPKGAISEALLMHAPSIIRK